MRPIDETNIRLLQNLQQDARTSVAELARRLRRSEATVRERLQYLESQGVVRGYRAEVDLEKLGIGCQAIVRANIDLRESSRIAKALSAIPNVTSASIVSGERPLRVRIVARNIRELEAILQERIAPLGLNQIDTRILLEDIIPNRPPDLEAVTGPGRPIATPGNPVVTPVVRAST